MKGALTARRVLRNKLRPAGCVLAVLGMTLLASWGAGSPAGGENLPVFVDVTSKAGVRFRVSASKTTEKYLIETMIGGVAAFDYDGDGLLDLYFVNGAKLLDPMPEGKIPDKSAARFWNRLYRNNGDDTFTDVTETAGVRGRGYGQGVAAADYDNDGHQDIYVTNFGKNILYHNNGDGAFTDVTGAAGVPGGGWSTSALFVDYDKDGFLDLFVSRYMVWDFDLNVRCGDEKIGYRSYCHPDLFKPISHLLYHNNGDGTFTDVTEESGVASSPGKGLGSGVQDFDRDGWPDIFVANDAVAEQLFRNNGDGTFEEMGVMAGVAYDEDGHAFSGMGVAFEDYNNDGWPDLFVTDLANQRFALFRNAEGLFEYVSGPTGVSRITRTHSGWGTALVDYDNDGWKDLFVAQSHVMDNIEIVQPSIRYLEPPLLMRNARGRFEDVSAGSGAPFTVNMPSRGAAFGDLNNDGFVDVAISCLDDKARILRNEGNGNHWIILNLTGVKSNRDGIGAVVRVVTEDGLEQHRMATTGGSYFSAGDKRVHFGLGNNQRAELIEITWPSGIVQKLEDVPADRILQVREPVE